MPKLKKAAATLLGATMLLGIGGSAFAGSASNGGDDQREAAQAMGAKVSLSQAVDAAQNAVGGNALDAGLADESGQGAWEIELAQADGSVKTVLVDMSTGAVDQTPKMENEKSERAGDHDDDGQENGEDAD